MSRRFPEDFLFGCATSAYQIEGGIENDWAVWERAGRLEQYDARCGLATDHWNRWQGDVDLLKAIGAEAYRFSVEWARVEPRPGEYDEAAVERYVRIVDALRERSIEPFVTLLHFTHPTWFHERCPWHSENGDGPARFAAFAEKMAGAFGDRVRFYTVLNEPAVWLAGAYFKGLIPPGRTSLSDLAAATTQLVRAHGLAHGAIRSGHTKAQVGIAKHFLNVNPSRPKNPFDRITARYVAHQFNHVFIQALISGRVQLGLLPGVRVVRDVPEAADTLDFLGVNVYSRVYAEIGYTLSARALQLFYEDRHGRGVTDLGWEIFPRGMTDALVEMARYGLPLYVTENGIDDRTDSRRAAFIHDHLGALLDAVDQGVDVRGYLHWSLLDNFEWLEAFGPRFGLYRVDYETMERTLTGSGAYYRSIIEQRSLPDERPSFRIVCGRGRTRVA